MKALLGAVIVYAASPFVLDDGERMDFWTWPEFEMHFAHLDVAAAAPAQPFIRILGTRNADGFYHLEMHGIDPTAAYAYRECSGTAVGVQDGQSLVGNDRHGRFGRFVLRPEGGNVRLIQIESGGCAVPGIYNLPKPVD